MRRVLGDRWADRIFGRDAEAQRVNAFGADAARQGPSDARADGKVDRPSNRAGASRTGSAQQATGSADAYVNDYRRQVALDAQDKLVRGARNTVYGQLDAGAGRRLAEGERPALGKQAIERTVLGADGRPEVQRWEVSPRVAEAVRTFEEHLRPEAQSLEGRGYRKLTGMLTKAQIAGMPVEATSHANTLTSIVASVPGEKDVVGKALAAAPALGAKAAAVREMAGVDFQAPPVRALQDRLARAGALRVETDRGGLVNWAHHWLFGPEGVDARGRLVLARKFLAREPNATDEQLRQFITSKLGNYVRANSGRAVNAAQDVGVSSFARFQAARIPTSLKTMVGESDLPSSSRAQRAGDRLNTLWRGPVGAVAGSALLTRLAAGHSQDQNERGHELDVDTGLSLRPTAYAHDRGRRRRRSTGIAHGRSRARCDDQSRRRRRAPDEWRARAPGVLPRQGTGRRPMRSRTSRTRGLGCSPRSGGPRSRRCPGRVAIPQSDGSFIAPSRPTSTRIKSSRARQGGGPRANPAVRRSPSGGERPAARLAPALAKDGQPLGGAGTCSRVRPLRAPARRDGGRRRRDNEHGAMQCSSAEYSDALTAYGRRCAAPPGRSTPAASSTGGRAC